MNTKTRCLASFASALFLLHAHMHAMGATLPFPPDQQVICTADVVDKEKVAVYLLKKYPVSLLAVSTCLGNVPMSNSPRVLLGALLIENVIKACPEADHDSLYAIRATLNSFLAGRFGDAYIPSTRVSPEKYLQSANAENAISCKKDVAGAPVNPIRPKPAPALSADSKIRIRGNPSHLIVDRSEPDFSTTDKASLSFNDNDIAGTRTSKATGYIGYALRPTGDAPDSIDLIPYVSVNRNVVTVSKGSSSKPSTTYTTNIGLLASMDVLTRTPFAIDHVLNVRPDYLEDHKNGSAILSLNSEYMPVVRRGINGFYPITQGSNVYLKPIFILKVNAGTYTDRGDVSVAASNKDFVRIGPQIGFSLGTDSPLLPLEYTGTYTGLAKVEGETKVNYRKHTLNYSLDAKKYMGIGLTRVSGVREDTGKTEKQWEIGLTVRY